MKQNRFLALAKKASERSDHKDHQLGCVIARGNRILGTGHNMVKTHTKSPHRFKNIHAEFLAVLNSGYDIEGATVYVYRQQKDGTPSISRPCPYCWKYLMEQGAKEVVYSFEGSYRQEKIA